MERKISNQHTHTYLCKPLCSLDTRGPQGKQCKSLCLELHTYQLSIGVTGKKALFRSCQQRHSTAEVSLKNEDFQTVIVLTSIARLNIALPNTEGPTSKYRDRLYETLLHAVLSCSCYANPHLQSYKLNSIRSILFNHCFRLGVIDKITLPLTRRMPAFACRFGRWRMIPSAYLTRDFVPLLRNYTAADADAAIHFPTFSITLLRCLLESGCGAVTQHIGFANPFIKY